MKERIKLFCIPYAGGSAIAYRCFQKYISSDIKMYAVELAGRGSRIKETGKETIREMAEDVYELIRNELDGTPFVIFAHSMGTLIAYELLYIIKEKNNMEPIHVFFSGRYTPDVKTDEKHYKLPDEEFLAMLKMYKGTPPQFFDYPELVDLFLPIIRRDYKAIETYEFETNKDKFDFEITAMAGREDCIVEPAQLEEWARFTKKECHVHVYNGDHFYLLKNPEIVCKAINKEVESWLKKEKNNGEL